MQNRRERRRQERQQRKASGETNIRRHEDAEHHQENSKSFKSFSLKPRNDEQRKYINTIKNFPFVVGMGTVGSGKTFIPAVMAAQMLQEGLIERIYIVRPNVELGKPIGFIKGGLWEKMEPWIATVMDGLESVMDRSFIKYLVEKEVIMAVPVAYLRGRTFSNCFVIGDEFQNLTVEEVKCFCQRQGEYTKVVVTGDLAQKDIDKTVVTGLDALVRIDEMYERKPMAVVRLETCVRSDEADFFYEAFEELEKETIQL